MALTVVREEMKCPPPRGFPRDISFDDIGTDIVYSAMRPNCTRSGNDIDSGTRTSYILYVSYKFEKCHRPYDVRPR